MSEISNSKSDNSKEVNFQQIVEDIKKLKGKTLTLSWESKINKNMTISCLIYSFTSDNNPIKFADINETYDSSLNIQKHSLTFEIPEDLNPTCSDLRIRIIRRTSEAELSVELRNVKLEIGDHPTEFVPRLYGEELALCQRYYEYIQRCIGITNPSMDNLRGQYPFKVTKRIIPNIKYGFGELENVIACVKASNNELFTIKPTTDPSSNEYGIIIDSNLGMNDYKYWEFYAKADAEIY